MRCSLNGITQTGNQNSSNNKTSQVKNGGEMIRNVENVGKHSITDEKCFAEKATCITVIKWDTGVEYVAPAGQ